MKWLALAWILAASAWCIYLWITSRRLIRRAEQMERLISDLRADEVTLEKRKD